MAHDLRPFRDYDEKDVINIFSYNETVANIESTPVLKGALVKISTGWSTSNNDLAMLEGAGANTVSNTVSQRYAVASKIVACGVAGEPVLGMTLFDVREKDENGELLKFNPRKAAEMQAVLVGQAVPVVRRGTFLVETDTDIDGSAEGWTALYTDAAGEFTATAGAGNIIGRTLGSSVAATNAAGTACFHTLILLDCALHADAIE
jgi:hypothetical protein